ncbi:hypothetical protein M9Y10_029348 [Tritrichomonas musculus]|uniref:Band 7 domain-containing protein n=1 Tax=Tritrichomonas musculus TaxID=1915356 RepID=A0ABR2KLW7_9EUKA
MIFLIFLFSFIKCEGGDLPYDDSAPKIDEDYTESNEENNNITPTPEPTPEITIPLKDLLGTREIIVGVIFFLCIIFYFKGKSNIQKSINSIEEKLAPAMRKYFLIVPDCLKSVSIHEHLLYLTGRSGYMGGFVTVKLSKRIDFIGYLWDKLFGNKTTITFEFLCSPLTQSTAIYSVRKKILHDYKPYDLKETPIPELGLTVFTDFGIAANKLTELVKNYGNKHSNLISEIDMNDMNRFETRIAGRFVARFNFIVTDLNNIIDEETIDFMMKMADSFITLELDEEAYQRNIRVRALNASKGTDIDPQTMADSLYKNKVRYQEKIKKEQEAKDKKKK